MGKLRQRVRWLPQNYKGSKPFHRLTKLQLNHAACLCICWASSLAAPGVESAPFSSMEAIKIRSKLSPQQPANLWQLALNALNVFVWKSLHLPQPPRSFSVPRLGVTVWGCVHLRWRLHPGTEEAATPSPTNLGLERTVGQTLTLQPPLPCPVLTSPCGKLKEKKPRWSLSLRTIS